MSEGIYRYPSNIAAMPTGARVAGERMERAMNTHEAVNKRCPLKLVAGAERWRADCDATDCMAWRETGEDEGFCVLYQIASAPAVTR